LLDTFLGTYSFVTGTAWCTPNPKINDANDLDRSENHGANHAEKRRETVPMTNTWRFYRLIMHMNPKVKNIKSISTADV